LNNVEASNEVLSWAQELYNLASSSPSKIKVAENQ
jgi:hypothetical protein